MRVIAGSARGRPLRGPRGSGTRPTSDKVKGAIFSALETLLASIEPTKGVGFLATGPPVGGRVGVEALESVWTGLRVLDLYAGTGALGIEALSRGADRADFVDVSSGCQRLIRENLERTGLGSHGRVVGAAVLQVLDRPQAYGLDGPYEVVLVDPPYDDPTLEPTLAALARGGLLASAALVVVEHSRRSAPAEAYDGLELIRRRRYGDTEVSYYLRRSVGDVG